MKFRGVKNIGRIRTNRNNRMAKDEISKDFAYFERLDGVTRRRQR